MSRLAALALTSSLLASSVPTQETAEHAPLASPAEVFGLVLPSTDPELDVAFYRKVFGMKLLHRGPQAAFLDFEGLVLILDGMGTRPEDLPATRLYLNLQVPDLRAAAETVEAEGGTALHDEPRRFALGHSITVTDPSGNPMHLIDLEQTPPVSKPTLFNLGVLRSDIAALEALFVAGLDFAVFSRDYGPETLPLDLRGRAALVLHGDGAEGRRTDPDGPACPVALLLLADDPAAACSARAPVEATEGVPTPYLGPALQLRAAGLDLRVLAKSAVAAAWSKNRGGDR